MSAVRLGITPAQRHQIDRLTVQIGLHTIRGRNEYVGKEVGRAISHLVDLNQTEAQAVIDVLKVEVASKVVTEAERTLCQACSGTGRTCAVCTKSVKQCIDDGGGGHFYDPVVCTACGGERFE